MRARPAETGPGPTGGSTDEDAIHRGGDRRALGRTGMAEVKVGMITTLSGGRARGLGLDVRTAFFWPSPSRGATTIELVIEDDQQKPDIAVQIADEMIQSERVDVMTGIIWSNLAMAVVPAAGQSGRVLPLAQRRPLAVAGRGDAVNPLG